MNDYPFILAHGIARFDILQEVLRNRFPPSAGLFDDDTQYFKGIGTFLMANGFEVYHTSVDFAGPLEKRADQLGEQIKEIQATSGKQKLHIIAHSMGGLDARLAIGSRDDIAAKVASLTTIGTPHFGTSFADKGLRVGGEILIAALQPILNLKGFRDLTTIACHDLNESIRSQEAGNSVFYQTYSSTEALDQVFEPLQLSWRIIHGEEGDNDGLVSRTSQEWVPLLEAAGRQKAVVQKQFPFPADHLNEVGWWDPNELENIAEVLTARASSEAYESKVKQVYLEIAQAMQAMGV
jgi:triacylglycerol lipase